MQKITTFLTFNHQAEEAVSFYTSLFENSRINNISRYGPEGPLPQGMVMTADFELAGQSYTALNAGPNFKFSDGFSLFVLAENQEEIDRLWNAFSDGGEPLACGWIRDRYGLAWQVIPRRFMEIMNHEPDHEKKSRVMQALWQMIKIDLPTLEAAYRGE